MMKWNGQYEWSHSLLSSILKKWKATKKWYKVDQIYRLDGDLSPLFMIVIFRFTSLVTVGSKWYTFYYKKISHKKTLQWTKN